MKDQGRDAAVRLVIMQLLKKLHLLGEDGKDSTPHYLCSSIMAIQRVVK